MLKERKEAMFRSSELRSSGFKLVEPQHNKDLPLVDGEQYGKSYQLRNPTFDDVYEDQENRGDINNRGADYSDSQESFGSPFSSS